MNKFDAKLEAAELVFYSSEQAAKYPDPVDGQLVCPCCGFPVPDGLDASWSKTCILCNAEITRPSTGGMEE